MLYQHTHRVKPSMLPITSAEADVLKHAGMPLKAGGTPLMVFHGHANGIALRVDFLKGKLEGIPKSIGSTLGEYFNAWVKDVGDPPPFFPVSLPEYMEMERIKIIERRSVGMHASDKREVELYRGKPLHIYLDCTGDDARKFCLYEMVKMGEVMEFYSIPVGWRSTLDSQTTKPKLPPISIKTTVKAKIKPSTDNG